MNLEEWLRDSKRWLEKNSSPLGHWLDETKSQWNQDPKQSNSSQEFNQWQKQIANWGHELTDRFRNLDLESSIPDSIRDFQDFGSIQKQLQNEWIGIAEWLKLGDRYRDAIQTLVQLYLQNRFDLLNLKQSPEEETQAPEKTPPDISEKHRHNAKELAALCKRQGGTWIKAAQFLSTQGDWLPREYREELEELQDQAPGISWDQVVEVLEESLGSDWNTRFSDIDPNPVATASLAQVHRATLTDGRICAIKVQLPDAPMRIDADLKFFALAAKMFKDQLPGLDPEQLVRELSRSVLLELDYAQEAENLTRFSKCYQSFEWTVPQLIPELLSSKTLGMSFLEGTPIRHFLEEVPSTAEPVLKTLCSSFMRQIFISGLFHADPHPGNFFITPRGQIALLDFGAMGELSENETSAYREVLSALLFKQQEGLIEKMNQAGFVVNQPERLIEMLFKAQDKNKSEGIADSDKTPFSKLETKLRILREAEVELPDSFVLMARVLISLGGLLNQHQVKLTPMEWAAMLMQQQPT